MSIKLCRGLAPERTGGLHSCLLHVERGTSDRQQDVLFLCGFVMGITGFMQGPPQIFTPSICLPHPPCCQSDPHTNAGGSPRSSARVRDTPSGGEGLCEGRKHFWLMGIPHSAEPNSALKHSGSAASVPGRSSQPCLESWFWFLYSCIHVFMYSCSS